MSVVCTAPPWPASCLEALARVLESGDSDRMLSWLGHHVDERLSSWTAFAVAVIKISSTLWESAGRDAGIDVWVPGADASLPQEMRDAELLTTMVLNSDWPGVNGLMAAIEDRGGIPDLCGALMATATTMLQLEATIRSDR